jgi:hypothetical protein
MKIIQVDCNYVQSEFASAYLLVHQGKGIFIESNTNHAISYLKKAAISAGLSLDQVVGLVITHIHLDHAGGAGLFLQEFPNAKLFAHPRAARHAIDPSKLIASATAVYGESFMKKLYGEILPCDRERVVALEDGASLDFQGIELKVKHTRGHANHHLVVIEPKTKKLFSGDSFGVSYPKISNRKGLLVLPSTSPTDFDGVAAIETVEWIARQDLEQIGLTHFGFINKSDIPKALEQMRAYLQYSIELLEAIKANHLDVETITQNIQEWVIQYYSFRGIHLDSEDLKILALDFKVNAQGLHFVANKNDGLTQKE